MIMMKIGNVKAIMACVMLVIIGIALMTFPKIGGSIFSAHEKAQMEFVSSHKQEIRAKVTGPLKPRLIKIPGDNE